MTWFFISILGPFLFAATNHIDKILLKRYFKDGGVGTLVLFSSLLSVFALPVFFWIDPTVLDVDWLNMFFLVVVGVCNVLVIYCYLLALKKDEASIVVVFYQLVPVFGYVLGYLILGETLTKLQLIASIIIILGTSIVAFEIDVENRFRLRKATVLFMTIAAFLWGLESVIFKFVALDENVVRSLFWEHVVLATVGVVVFLTVKKAREQFIVTFRENSSRILSLNFINEVIYMCGNAAVASALILAPVSLVLLGNSFQPIFVFIIGVILTVFFPKVAVEKIHAHHIWQKLLAILVTGVGTYIILTTDLTQ